MSDGSSPQPLTDAARLKLAEKVLRHRFSDKDLLRRALTHPSAEATEPLDSYERLEFLGDAVISFVVSESVYRRFPSLREGDLTRIRIAAVNGVVLGQVARELGLDRAVDIGNREMLETGRGVDSALENAFEALVAALYLDAGIDAARTFVERALSTALREDATVPEHPKSALIEEAASAGKTIAFEIVSAEGPPHSVEFTAQVLVDGKALGTGSGRTKKEAETTASEQALKALRKQKPTKRPRR